MNTGVRTPYKIIFEDNHLLVVIKPHGVVSQVDEYHEKALDSELKSYIKMRDNKPGNVFLTAVHRLDKPAAGLVIFAKTSKALERMNQLMKDRAIKKTYLACLEDTPVFDQGSLIHYLEHRHHMAEVVPESKGKKAELFYKIVAKKDKKVWVEVDLKTGRYHQIRAQFAAIGCPIIGDVRYGSPTKLPFEAIKLIHTRAEFIHPVTKAPLEFVHPDLDDIIDF